jgi:beta-galactosidase
MNSAPLADRFLFGVSAYPEVLGRDDWLGMLDRFAALGMSVVRLGESAWGHLEPEQGHYDIDWLERCVDDVAARGLHAIVGTNTYIAPQWLFERHPDVAAQLVPGDGVHSMYRKAASIAHPAYRGAAFALVERLAERLGRHEGILGWQVDNEIDAGSLLVPDYSAAGDAAWSA